MGNSKSVEKTLKKQDEKIYNIEVIGNRLNQTYEEKYLDPEFCNQVMMISNDGLLRFHHQKVDGKNYSFGYIGDVPTVKQAICDGIQEEYRLKKELIIDILNCFQECNSRLDSVTRGPTCTGNPEALEKENCRSPSRWIETVATPDPKVKQNNMWFKQLSEMHSFFMKQLTILENILLDLQRNDNTISIDKVRRMKTIVEKVKRTLYIECSKFQKLMLTIPVFTREEIMEKDKIDLENKQKQEAKKFALLNPQNMEVI